ncbi:HAD-IIB family hydrolase [Acidimangrovimonas sediminis]|uniref:HAD-IIB family hydrolase n=1 Tax=Acidimangrovimonas sediminis TaxID=2056283 RepID=UPI000C80500F|nr:HAD hydrolase family protein [Acidimangrovimonas sediminis]
MRLAVFTDLDGTLLDHETYDWQPAAGVLARLVGMAVPVILASSKTAAEIAPLRSAMGLGAFPAIVENGAGVLPGGADRPDTARTHPALMASLADAPPGFQGFTLWGAEEIARRTGLPPEAAARAAERDFSEPGVFEGPEEDLKKFLQYLETKGIKATRGGRFLTLSLGGTKADRMAEIAAALGTDTTVALGDAPNDIPMLQAADYAVVIPNPAHAGPWEGLGQGPDGTRLRAAPDPGPKGWASALDGLLSDLDI